MNLAKLFEQVLPRRLLQVGLVVAVSADGGVCTVLLPGGGRIRARGEAEVNDKVFVRDGVIEGPAPDLPVVSIEV